ncbi:MAG: UbiX family flavin prenyltransferase [Saprospiraceae bacterium]|nr:UbiX family flavin prenyltransferase [Saprospiraceae bacterium]
MRKLVIAITGSSGSIYAKVLLDKLAQSRDQWTAIGVVLSDNARLNWEIEIGPVDFSQYPFDFYQKNDFNAPFASGSARYDTMIVCPCSMGMLARIATGVSNDLITRAADVVFKERRRLLLVTRDTPLSLIHINNMKTVTEAGGIICPACPSFYSKPQTLEEIAATVVDRVLDLAGLEQTSYRWGETDLPKLPAIFYLFDRRIKSPVLLTFGW